MKRIRGRDEVCVNDLQVLRVKTDRETGPWSPHSLRYNIPICGRCLKHKGLSLGYARSSWVHQERLRRSGWGISQLCRWKGHQLIFNITDRAAAIERYSYSKSLGKEKPKP